MIRFIPALIAIAALVALTVFFADQPGSVSLVWLGWRIDMPAGPDRLVAEAQQALAAGDLAGAIQRVKQIDAAGAQPWLDAAQARLDCEQAAQALDAEAVKRLSGGAEGGAAE